MGAALFMQNRRGKGFGFLEGDEMIYVDGGDAECCDLLTGVVKAGFRVIEYRPRRADLEQIFLDVTRGEVQ